jgi:hypothetical protein
MDAYRNIVEFAELTTIGITPKNVARMKDARGMRLRVETGSVWITQDRCRDDVCLDAGESHCITHNGLTVITAVQCPLALVSIEPRAPAAQSMAERFWNFWGGLYAPASRPTTASL